MQYPDQVKLCCSRHEKYARRSEQNGGGSEKLPAVKGRILRVHQSLKARGKNNDVQKTMQNPRL